MSFGMSYCSASELGPGHPTSSCGTTKKKYGRKPGFAQDFYVKLIFSTIFIFKSEYKSCQIHQILLCMVSACPQKTQQPTEHASAPSPKHSSKPNSISFVVVVFFCTTVREHNLELIILKGFVLIKPSAVITEFFE